MLGRSCATSSIGPFTTLSNCMARQPSQCGHAVTKLAIRSLLQYALHTDKLLPTVQARLPLRAFPADREKHAERCDRTGSRHSDAMPHGPAKMAFFENDALKLNASLQSIPWTAMKQRTKMLSRHWQLRYAATIAQHTGSVVKARSQLSQPRFKRDLRSRRALQPATDLAAS